MNDQIKIENCGEQILKCSDCHKPLMHWWQYAKVDSHVEKIKANCPFCGGHSFVQEITGGFYAGPISQREIGLEATVIDDSTLNEEGIWVFSILKRNK